MFCCVVLCWIVLCWIVLCWIGLYCVGLDLLGCVVLDLFICFIEITEKILFENFCREQFTSWSQSENSFGVVGGTFPSMFLMPRYEYLCHITPYFRSLNLAKKKINQSINHSKTLKSINWVVSMVIQCPHSFQFGTKELILGNCGGQI